MKKAGGIFIIITILACLALQLFTSFKISDISSQMIAGALLVILPAIAVEFAGNNSQNQETDDSKEKWRTIPIDEWDRTVKKIENQKINVIDLKWYGRIFAFLTSIGMLITACIISFCMIIAEDYDLGCILLDVVAIPRALFYMIYGCTPHDAKYGTPFSPKITAKLPCAKDILRFFAHENSANNANKPNTLRLEPQLQITQKGKVYSFTDIRLNIVPATEIKNLLCAMISISENSVQDKKYPYAYGVFVFKGTKAFHNNIIELPSCGHFKLETKKQDGNSLFIILKSSGTPEYCTTSDNCMELINIMKEMTKTFIANNR